MKRIMAILGLVLLLSMLFTEFWKNLYLGIQDPSYVIPKESSMLSFRSTEMNNGSGDWWIYGEDGENYYGLNDTDGIIYYIPKFIAREQDRFNPKDMKTWSKKWPSKTKIETESTQ